MILNKYNLFSVCFAWLANSSLTIVRKMVSDVTVQDSLWLLRRKMNGIFLLLLYLIGGFIFFCLGRCSNHPSFISSQDSRPRATMRCGESTGRSREYGEVERGEGWSELLLGWGDWQDIWTPILPGSVDILLSFIVCWRTISKRSYIWRALYVTIIKYCSVDL